jgi:hypothetical protein
MNRVRACERVLHCHSPINIAFPHSNLLNGNLSSIPSLYNHPFNIYNLKIAVERKLLDGKALKKDTSSADR